MCAVVVHKRHHRKGKMPVSCRRRCPGALFQSLKDFPFIKTHVWRGGRLNSALARTSARSVIGGGIIRLLHRNRTGGPRPGESEAGVPARGAYNENALAEGDAAATAAAAADWGENAAVCVTEGAPEEVRLSLTGGPPPAGLDFEDMIALIGARNAER